MSLTDNGIVTETVAKNHFDTFPFNTRVTEETAHRAKELRAKRKSKARILHMQTTRPRSQTQCFCFPLF